MNKCFVFLVSSNQATVLAEDRKDARQVYFYSVHNLTNYMPTELYILIFRYIVSLILN